jgi:predicted  nucleic acid-binding Zn-ribbon protein
MRTIIWDLKDTIANAEYEIEQGQAALTKAKSEYEELNNQFKWQERRIREAKRAIEILKKAGKKK